MSSCFIEPMDLLSFRGNSLFGAPGSYGKTLMPPWPSVFAGALRSHVLVQTGIDLTRFAGGSVEHPLLGTPLRPSGLRVLAAQPARRTGSGVLERFYPLPADLVVQRDSEGVLALFQLSPVAFDLEGSGELEKLAVLKAPAGKPEAGYCLSAAGWQAYLSGATPAVGTLVPVSTLWQTESRTGIALDPDKRSAADGSLFNTESVAMQPGCGFAVDVAGIDGHTLEGVLRLGGDGRGARVHCCEDTPHYVDLEQLAASGRCRIALTSPGIFPLGWKLPGMDEKQRFCLHGVSARVVCAAVPRAETISGWDMATRRPKPAHRAAAAGSVYWLEDLHATPAALGKLAESGLWPTGSEHETRCTEGFNRFVFAQY